MFRIPLIAILFFGWALTACQQSKRPKIFRVKGSFTNTGGSRIYLAELPFGSSQRTVLDTATLDAKGNFELQAIENGEGIYQVFVERGPGLMLVNDVDEIELHADARKMAAYTTPGSRTNENLRKMFNDFVGQDSVYRVRKKFLDSVNALKMTDPKKDSLLAVAMDRANLSQAALKRTLKVFIETEPNGTAVYFASGMAKAVFPESDWTALLQSAIRRFPNHPGLQILRVNNSAQNSIDQQGRQLMGAIVPDISLPDTSGKNIAVSSFRGKWLLIDFWASWCAPCRAENPNVVAAFKQFSSRNFTVLGISLDLQKAAWLKAIQQDGLTWAHISDLKQWQSQAVDLYGLNGIPFNILVDPAGKVVAVNLRGADLQKALAANLK